MVHGVPDRAAASTRDILARQTHYEPFGEPSRVYYVFDHRDHGRAAGSTGDTLAGSNKRKASGRAIRFDRGVVFKHASTAQRALGNGWHGSRLGCGCQW